MSPHDLAIDAEAAQRIDAILLRFLEESDATDALLIDLSGQLLARSGASPSLDTVSLSALAAGAFSSTAAMARLVEHGSRLGSVSTRERGDGVTPDGIRSIRRPHIETPSSGLKPCGIPVPRPACDATTKTETTIGGHADGTREAGA